MLLKDPPVQITDRLWMLGTNAFPLYLYQGDENLGYTIFEGVVSAMGPVLDQQLNSLGVTHDQVRRVIVTHAHPDHVMAIPVFRQMFPEVSVIASEPAAKTLQIEKAVAFFGKMDEALTSWLVERGLIDTAGQGEPVRGPIAVDRVVGEGDRVEVGQDVAFEVLETPGHSVCSLSFYEPQDSILIISDATGYYLPDQDYMWPGYLTDYGDYLRSIERLAAKPAETLCLSHNAVIRGADEVAAYFQRAVAETEKYHNHIVTQAKSGASVQTIAQVLGADIYERTGQLTLDFFQKNCSLLIKNSLRHEGLATDQ